MANFIHALNTDIWIWFILFIFKIEKKESTYIWKIFERTDFAHS